jgi:hypothetical protein
VLLGSLVELELDDPLEPLEELEEVPLECCELEPDW